MSSQLFFQDKFSNLRYDVITKAQTAIFSTDFESDCERIVLCKNGFISRRKFVLSEGTDKTDGFHPLCDIGSPLDLMKTDGFLSSADNRNLTRADKNQKDASSKMFSYALASLGSTPENYRSKGGFESRMQYEKAS